MTNPADTHALIAELVEVAQGVEGIISNCNVESGVCCCGDSIERHPDPIYCGHSPVDSGANAADALLKKASSTIAKARAALANGEVESGPAKTVSGYPRSYPSLVFLGEGHVGSCYSITMAKCTPISWAKAAILPLGFKLFNALLLPDREDRKDHHKDFT